MAKKKDLLIKNRNLWGWIFSAQTVIAIILSLIYPLVYAIILSFTDVRFITENFNWVKLDNYAWLIKESDFFKDLMVSISFAIVSTAVQTVLGFLLAFMLYFMKGKTQTFFKTALYLPVILPTSVIS